MKILLSAYACEPDKGSEPGVGWNWALELARLGLEVWVLTRLNNQPAIEKFFSKETRPHNLHFIYYDLPKWASWWKKGQQSVRLYYLLWQWRAYLLAKRIHEKERFDCVHHVTFVSVRQPSFMGNLGIPFIFGPVGGGERAPLPLRYGYGPKGHLLDIIRDCSNFFIRFDPLMRMTFHKARRIYVTSSQTRQVIPKRFWHKIEVRLAIGINKQEKSRAITNKVDGQIRILYVGRFLYWKGMHLGIESFARLLEKMPQASLTMLGKGPEEKKWKDLAEKLGVADHVHWIPWVDSDNLPELYGLHNLLLFPSLHDSGGMVVLEAMACGLPVICFDLGGPGTIVNESCGRVIKASCMTREETITDIVNVMAELSTDRSILDKLSRGALCRAREFHWSQVIQKVCSEIGIE